MDSHWLLFNTSICRWIVNMCYIFQFKNETKNRSFTIEFDEMQRYNLKIAKCKNYYAVKLIKNNVTIGLYEFENPIQFCEKLKADTNVDVVEFVDLILFVAGFRL